MSVSEEAKHFLMLKIWKKYVYACDAGSELMPCFDKLVL